MEGGFVYPSASVFVAVASCMLAVSADIVHITDLDIGPVDRARQGVLVPYIVTAIIYISLASFSQCFWYRLLLIAA